MQIKGLRGAENSRFPQPEKKGQVLKKGVDIRIAL